MANKQEIEKVLRELNMTEEQMDVIWQENVAFGYNHTIMALHNSNLNWRNLSTIVIKKLPQQLEKDKRSKKIAEQVEIMKANVKVEVVKTKTLEEKVLAKEHLTEHELSELVHEYCYEEIKGDDNRWTRNMQTIVNIGDRFFSIYWQQGLTECQEDEFLDQPIEVKPHTYEKTITVTDWEEI